MPDLGELLPPFDPTAKAPNSTVNAYDTDAKPVALPTWNPDVRHRDAEIAKIAAVNHDGEYGTLDGNHPGHVERTAAVLPSHQLLTGEEKEGHEAVGPHPFARSGGTPRK